MTSRPDSSRLTRSSAIHSIPDDHVRLTARRLGIAAAVSAVADVVYIVLYRTVWVEQAHTAGLVSGLAALVISSAVAWYLLGPERPARHVVVLGVAYEIFLAFTLAISESSSVDYSAPSAQVPWGAIVIALFPFLIPAGPRLILGASMAAAATTPLTMALTFAVTSRPWPSLPIVASYVLPLFVCAVLAWAPASALHRLRRDVQHARRLGSYDLDERLGKGGMGEVWRARHRLLARPAAVKLIQPEMLGAKDAASRETLMRRFEREARVTASLESPHTVELYDFGVSADGVLFYVMELLHGLDLQTWVERYGALPPERVVHLLLQACDSLEEAHRRGLIHRDVKPANLFVARKGVAFDVLKVLDFGLVKRWGTDDDGEFVKVLESAMSLRGDATGVGQIVGTPAFLAPEAALGEQALDHRADLYALGCVAYWMLAGAMVFEEKSALQMAIAHVTKEPAPPSLRSGAPIPAELEAIVMSCLSKDREQRPSSAQALRERLARLPLARSWTNERAAEWWREHLPEARSTPPRELSGRVMP